MECFGLDTSIQTECVDEMHHFEEEENKCLFVVKGCSKAVEEVNVYEQGDRKKISY